MKATDLRIGNLYYYRVVDQLDKRKEWFEVSKIDYDDLRVIAIKDEMNQDYQPIPLNEEWLVKLGFTIKNKPNGDIKYFYKDFRYSLICKVNYDGYLFCDDDIVLRDLDYIHELQNIYFVLTGTELTQK